MSSLTLTRSVKALVLALAVLFAASPAASAAPHDYLRLGDRGPRVAAWQADLNTVSEARLAVDGIFGPKTDRATRRFQADAGLAPDGIVGPRTQRALQQQTARTASVRVFFSDISGGDCSRTSSVQRTVAFPAVLRGALTELLQGPTQAERQHLEGSLFGPHTAGLLRDVQIRGRTAHVDFDPALTGINNVSTSCMRAALTAQLDATATQFPTVDDAVYSIGGERCRFQELIGTASC